MRESQLQSMGESIFIASNPDERQVMAFISIYNICFQINTYPIEDSDIKTLRCPKVRML